MRGRKTWRYDGKSVISNDSHNMFAGEQDERGRVECEERADRALQVGERDGRHPLRGRRRQAAAQSMPPIDRHTVLGLQSAGEN